MPIAGSTSSSSTVASRLPRWPREVRDVGDGDLASTAAAITDAPDLTPSVPLETLQPYPCVVLLGEAGSGKTTSLPDTLPQLESQTGERLAISGNEIRGRERLITLRLQLEAITPSASMSLVIDGLDEAGVSVLSLLRELFSVRTIRSGFTLRLSCRTADWSSDAAVMLREVFSRVSLPEGLDRAVKVVALAPLSLSSLELGALALGLPPEPLVTAVTYRGLEPLVRTPLTLKLLLEHYVRAGSLPSSRNALFLEACRQLCLLRTGPQARQPRELKPDERLTLAARLAALSVFCGKPVIDLSDREPEALRAMELCHPALPRERCPDGQELEIRPWMFEAVVRGTGLFVPAGGSRRFRFYHQSLAECLAAQYLQWHQASTPQILSLLLHPAGGIVPSMRDLASWLDEGFGEEVRAALIHLDPFSALAGDVQSRPGPEKRLLVDALLEAWREERGHHFYFRREKLLELRHPEMVGQLKPWLTDASRGERARKKAIELVFGCGLETLYPAVVEIALDRFEPLQLRIVAAQLIATYGDRVSRLALRPLLELEPGEDQKEDLKGNALLALWTESALTCEELFSALTVPRESHYFGAYRSFLERKTLPDEIAARFGVAGMERALEWLSDIGRHRYSDYHWRLYGLQGFLDGLFRRIARSLENQPVAAQLARWLLDHKFSYVLHELWASVRILGPEKRWLLRALLEHPESNIGDLHFAASRILTSQDLPWLAGWMLEVPRQEAVRLLPFFRAAMAQADVDQLQPLRDWLEQAPELFEPFESALFVRLGSPEAERLRGFHAERQAHYPEEDENRGDDGRRPSTTREARVARALELSREGNPNGWAALIDALERASDGEPAPDFSYEASVHESPGWKEAPGVLREEILGSAYRFLEQYDPPLEDYPSTRRLTMGVSMGLQAIILLYQQEKLEELPDTVWAKWAGAIVSWAGGPQHGEMQEPLVRAWLARVPEVTSRWFDRMLRELEPAALRWFLQQVPWATLPSLEPRIQAVFVIVSGSRRAALLEHLLMHGLAVGLSALESELSTGVSDPAPDEDWLEVARLGIQHAPALTWPYIVPWLETHPEAGQKLLESACRGIVLGTRIAHSVPEPLRMPLFTWLRGHYPPEPETEYGGVRKITPAYELRTLCFQLVQASLEASPWETIEAMRDHLRAHADWLELRHWIPWAEELARKRTWLPPTPAQVLHLLACVDHRLVFSEAQLREAVSHAFERWSEQLNRIPETMRTLWERVAQGGFRPAPFEWILETVRRSLATALCEWVVNQPVNVEMQEQRLKISTGPDASTFSGFESFLDLLTCWQLEVVLRRRPAGEHPPVRILWFDSPSWFRSEDPERWVQAHRHRRDEIERLLRAHVSPAEARGSSFGLEVAPASTVGIELQETMQQLSVALPFGEALMRALQRDEIQVRGCSSVGDEQQWHVWIQWPESVQERYGVAPAGLMLCQRGPVRLGDLRRARERLREAEHAVDVDLLIVVDGAPELARRLERTPGAWGQWIPWQEAHGEFPSLTEMLPRYLPAYDLFEQRSLVYGRQLFGREEERSTILRRVRRGESVSMVGLRRVGKTSLARDIARTLKGPETVIELAELSGEVGGGWTVLWQDVQILPARTLDSLLGELEAQLPAGDSEPGIDSTSDGLSRWIRRLEALLRSGEHGVCIFMDEFDLLYQGLDGQGPIRGISAFLHGMKGLAQQYQRLSLVLIGRDPTFLDAGQLEGGPNPMLGWVTPCWIRPLSPGGSKELLTTIARRMALSWPEPLLHKAQEWTGGHPMLLRQFGSAWLEIRRQAIPEDDTPMAFMERDIVQGIVTDIEDLLRLRYPASYELLKELEEVGAGPLQAHLRQAGGWYGIAARVLRNFGILQGTPTRPFIPLMFRPDLPYGSGNLETEPGEYSA